MKQAANEVISIRQAQDAAAQVELAPHPLEFNAAEREWFLKACNNYVTAYRRAVQVLPEACHRGQRGNLLAAHNQSALSTMRKSASC
jgi:hypothetical protein